MPRDASAGCADLAGRAIEVHRDPKGGRFERTFLAKPGESTAPLVAFPEASFAVSAVVH